MRINLEWLIWEDNPRSAIMTHTDFFKWLQGASYWPTTREAVTEYLTDRYDWEHGATTTGEALYTLILIYDFWWYEYMAPVRNSYRKACCNKPQGYECCGDPVQVPNNKNG